MKKISLLKVLAITAFVFMTMGAFAQTWNPPVEPSGDYLPSEGVEPVDGGIYYIYNVDLGQFLTGGNEYARRIKISSDKVPYMQIKVEAVTDETLYLGCFKMKLNGSYVFSGTPEPDYASRECSNTYLYRNIDSSGSSAYGYIDRGSQPCWYWKFIPKGEDGIYYIQSAPGMNALNESGDEYFVAPEPGANILMNAPIDSEGATWQFFGVEDLDTRAADYKAAYSAYQARLILYDLLNDAVQFSADTSEASEVYNNPDATAEELTAVTETLRANVRLAYLAWAAKNATAEAPINVTNYALVNPDFEIGNMSGWTITSTMSSTRQYQNNRTYPNPDKDLLISKFIEAWNADPLGDGFISQTVHGLPAGHYILECDAMGISQKPIDGDEYVDPADYEGVHLFYTDGEIVVHSDQNIRAIQGYNEEGEPDWWPDHFVFEFDIEAVDSINLGIMTQGANVTWVVADNFSLSAAGPSQTPPSYTALRAEYSTSSKLLDSDYEAAQKSLEEALKQAIENARSLVEAVPDASKVEAYTAAFTAMNNARAELQTSIATYAKLAAFIEKLESETDIYKAKANCGPIADRISAMAEELQDKYDDGTISTDEINETINGYNDFIKQATQELFDQFVAEGKALDEPFDISILFPTMEYAYGTSQIVYQNGYPADNPVWMNATNTGNFKVSYSTAEVWDAKPFEIYREFPNMPVGKYTIETNGFTRCFGDVQGNYDMYASGERNEGYAYLYAGNNHTEFPNQASLVYTENRTGCKTLTGTDGQPLYVPGNQQSFYNLLHDTDNPEYIEKSRFSASTVITEEGGTLRVGVVGTDMLTSAHWTVWSTFHLYYSGIDDTIIIDGLNDDIRSLIEDATVLTFFTFIEESANLLESAIAQGNEALENSDVQTKKDAVAALKNAIDTANESQKILNQLMDIYDEYIAKFEELDGDEYTYTDFEDLWDDITEAISSEGIGVESNEQMLGWIEELPISYLKYVLSDTRMDTATEDEPFDATSIIVNWNFASASPANLVAPRGWTIELENSNGHVESNSGGYEIWNTGAARLSQALPTLREGYWRLTVDGFFRTGTVDETQQRYNDGTLDVYAYLFLNDLTKKLYSSITEGMYTFEDGGLGGKTYNLDDVGTVYIPDAGWACQNYFNAGYYTANAIDFKYTDGPVEFGVFKNADTTLPEDWIYIDNFHLYYLGTTAPTAVESLTAEEGQVPAAAIYSIDGRRQSRLQRGINIVRRADGTVTKILVK